jgi:uncharacterized protein (TIGR02145 family)/uncharacterized repeat protein (TIGR02543 family)
LVVIANESSDGTLPGLLSSFNNKTTWASIAGAYVSEPSYASAVDPGGAKPIVSGRVLRNVHIIADDTYALDGESQVTGNLPVSVERTGIRVNLTLYTESESMTKLFSGLELDGLPARVPLLGTDEYGIPVPNYSSGTGSYNSRAYDSTSMDGGVWTKEANGTWTANWTGLILPSWVADTGDEDKYITVTACFGDYRLKGKLTGERKKEEGEEDDGKEKRVNHLLRNHEYTVKGDVEAGSIVVLAVKEWEVRNLTGSPEIVTLWLDKLQVACMEGEPAVISFRSTTRVDVATTGEYGSDANINITSNEVFDLDLSQDSDGYGKLSISPKTNTATGTYALYLETGTLRKKIQVDVKCNCAAANMEINGVKWARCNTGMPGYFVAHEYDYGMFYQWNRKTGWPSSGSVTGWDSSTPSGTVWSSANDPCPTGWRVPTQAQIQYLRDNASSEWTTSGGINGRRFTYNGASIFLPASGYRGGSGGSLLNQGGNGYYWSATQTDSYGAWRLSFSSGYVGVSADDRAYGFSVRCVQAVQYTVTATASTGGTVTGSDTYMVDTEVTVTATPNTGYTFAGWYNGGTKVSDAASYTFTVTKNVTLEARFVDAVFEINGVKWAKFNVASPGTFAAHEYDYGMFYQWIRKTGGPSSGSVTGWDSSTPSGTVWSSTNDPCPTGWHVPTQVQMESLRDNASSEWTTSGGINGRRFTYNGASIFLPASGFRYYSAGALTNQGNSGYYWSATQDDSYYAWYLSFYSGAVLMGASHGRANGFSVRCVQE